MTALAWFADMDFDLPQNLVCRFCHARAARHNSPVNPTQMYLGGSEEDIPVVICFLFTCIPVLCPLSCPPSLD